MESQERTENTNSLPKNKKDSWVWRQAASQLSCSYTFPVQSLGLLTLLLLTWVFLLTLFGSEALPGGGLFTILSLILIAQLVGKTFDLIGLPPLLGMLVAGIAYRTAGFYTISGVYVKLVSATRIASLAFILIKAGMGLDPSALLKQSFSVVWLAVWPGVMEAATVGVMCYYILGYPWIWGLALGFLLCAISPAVIVPPLIKLNREGYGAAKGISTLVIAACSLDDVLSISVFNICISIMFSKGKSVALQVIQTPLDVAVGLGVGCFWGLLCGVIPHLQDEFLVWKRVFMVGVASLCGVFASSYIGYPGAGALISITIPFVANVLWNIQGWAPGANPVEDIFTGIWTVIEPILFGLIGAEIDLSLLQMEIVTWGVIIIVVALVMRTISCSLMLIGGKLNFKEAVFVNLAWVPKATVQAALAPHVLDMVRKMGDPSPEDLERGSQFLTIAVLSILITAPLGAIAVNQGGRRLLTKE